MTRECERYRVLIHGRLDGELNANEEKELKEHLATCEKCARAVEQVRGLTDDLNRMALDFAEAHVWEDVKARVLRAPRTKRRMYVFPVLLVATMLLYKVVDIRAGFGVALLLKPVVVAVVALLIALYKQNPFRLTKSPNGSTSATRR
jgi:anti-sigma factor RsiW